MVLCFPLLPTAFTCEHLTQVWYFIHTPPISFVQTNSPNYSNQLLISQFADHAADHASSPLNPERQTSSGSPSRREQARLHRVYQVWQGRRAAHKSLSR